MIKYTVNLNFGEKAVAIVKFSVGDTLVMKKKHPCGESAFTPLRCGSDVKIRCNGCGRELTLARDALEKSIKKVIYKDQDGNN